MVAIKILNGNCIKTETLLKEFEEKAEIIVVIKKKK